MGSALRLTGRSVLVVEDEPLISFELASAFAAAGAEVVTAESCSDALAALQRGPICAALLDFALKEDSVAPLCRALRDRGIPFMFYTGYTELERSYPDTLIVQKPASTDALLGAMVGLVAAGTRPQSAELG